MSSSSCPHVAFRATGIEVIAMNASGSEVVSAYRDFTQRTGAVLMGTGSPPICEQCRLQNYQERKSSRSAAFRELRNDARVVSAQICRNATM